MMMRTEDEGQQWNSISMDIHATQWYCTLRVKEIWTSPKDYYAAEYGVNLVTNALYHALYHLSII